ncbi:glycosyltransferase family 32 protein [Gilliamella sp. W8145]|uniref:glycosyltransferase family 32 protein n=1 Tax=Gilliamella sp. W8145 TaxID=2750990 RepID=UPI0018DE88BD|nr:glycosyltransferase [Gilliamella sp. W8145]MBI0103532.1 glycosyl transferase [Gilliamella sp. W8145]
MIPKIIHYCWFGNNPKPKKVLKNIEDWKEKLPDYKFVEWNDNHIKLINNQYVSEAYEARKFAFVSDFFRIYALLTEGGIYIDTDVTISKSFDSFLDLDFFSCYENWREIIHPISTATLGAVKNNPFIKEILDTYENDKFIKNGVPDLTTNVERITTLLKNKNLVSEPYNKFDTLKLSSKEIIFPSHFFCENIEGYDNYCVHEFYASWKDDVEDIAIQTEVKKAFKVKFKLNKKVVFVKLKQETIPNKILFSFSFNQKKYAFIII